MKGRYLILLSVALLLGFVAIGWAGEYHRGTTLICAQCHTMHYSLTHTYGTGQSWDTTWLMPGGPYEGLLKGHVTDLCLSCHDGKTSAPDVYGTNTGTHVRSAGALSGSHGSYSPGGGYEDWKGHTLWSTQQAPGVGGWTPSSEGLECSNCHLFHGTSGYRNLRYRVGSVSQYVTYAKGINDTTKDAFLRQWGAGAIPGN